MAVKQVNTSPATVQVKLGAGQLKQVICVAPGTTFTFQAKDGPDPNGNSVVLIGASAITVTTTGQEFNDPFAPITFQNGLQIVTTGTAGELQVQFD